MPGAKQPSLITAASVAKAAKQLGGVYVFSSVDNSILKEENASAVIAKQSFAKYACSDCTAEFSALKELGNPFCILCGSEHIGQKGVVAKQDIHPDSDLVSIPCRACTSTNIVHQEIAKSVNNHMHCATCGTELIGSIVVKASEDDEFGDDVSADDLDALDVDEVASETTDGEDDADGKGVTDSVAPGGADADPEVAENLIEDKVDNVALPSATPVAENLHVETPTDLPTPSKEAPVAEDLHDELPAAMANADEMPNNDYSEDIDMTDAVDTDDLTEMSVFSTTDSIMIASGPYILAQLQKEEAGENKDIFNSDSFRKAVISRLQSSGFEVALKDFGFKPVVLKASLKKSLQKKVEASVAGKTAQMDSERGSLVASWQQSIDIAAVGLNKNFWKIDNPLKAALVRDLESAGMKKNAADKLINRVFASHSLAYTTALIEQAKVLMKKSVEARNELADTLDMTGILASGSGDYPESEDDDGDEDDDFQVSSIRGLTDMETASVTRSRQVSSSEGSAIQRILSSASANGGSLFNS